VNGDLDKLRKVVFIS